MSSPMSRRTLLGTGASGLLLGSLLDSVRAKQQKDEIGDHILNEAKKLAKQAQSGVRQRETMTAFATNLRLHAAHIRSTGQDTLIADAVAKHIRRHGRQALIDAAHSPEAMQRYMDQMKAFGLDDLMIPEKESTQEQSDRALTSLLIPGTLAINMERMADAIDHVSERVAAAGQPHIVNVQIDFWCGNMGTLCNTLREAAAIICALSAAGFFELAPVCAIIGVEAATACLWNWLCS